MASNINLYNKITLGAPQAVSPVPSQTYVGFSTVNKKAENFKLFDFELIKQDLINLFNIRRGERLMNPEFGTVIWDMLFEPLTDEIKYTITQNVNSIINFDPRVSASEVIVTAYETGIQIQCMLIYRPYNIQQALQLRFDQSNGLLTA
jgi:phage baseplate assembly protein W